MEVSRLSSQDVAADINPATTPAKSSSHTRFRSVT